MNYIAYYRISTAKGGGLDSYGIEAQKVAVQKFLDGRESRLVASYSEVESGADNNRPQLAAAIAHAKSAGVGLVIGRLDRLSRNCAFLLQLQDSGLDFVCCDMPNADRFTIGILALVAQRERELISQRTRAGLAVAKSRGKTLGNPRILEARLAGQRVIKANKVAFAASAIKIIKEIQSTGVESLTKISEYLNKRGERSARGKQWTPVAVKRVLQCF